MELKNYDELIKYLKENVDTLEEMVQDINSYDSYFDHLEYWGNDEDFFNTYYYNNPMEVARAIFYGDYHYCDDYVCINVYGNLESITEYAFQEMLIAEVEDILSKWYEMYCNSDIREVSDEEFMKLLKGDVENESEME